MLYDDEFMNDYNLSKRPAHDSGDNIVNTSLEELAMP